MESLDLQNIPTYGMAYGLYLVSDDIPWPTDESEWKTFHSNLGQSVTLIQIPGPFSFAYSETFSSVSLLANSDKGKDTARIKICDFTRAERVTALWAWFRSSRLILPDNIEMAEEIMASAQEQTDGHSLEPGTFGRLKFGTQRFYHVGFDLLSDSSPSRKM